MRQGRRRTWSLSWRTPARAFPRRRRPGERRQTRDMTELLTAGQHVARQRATVAPKKSLRRPIQDASGQPDHRACRSWETAFSERGGGTTNSTQFSTPAYGLSIIAASSSSTSGHGRLPVAATLEALAPALRSYHPRRLPEVTQRRGVLPLPRVDSGLTDPVVCSSGERRAPCRRGTAVSTVNPRTGLRTVGAWSIPSRRRCHMPRVPQRRRVKVRSSDLSRAEVGLLGRLVSGCIRLPISV